jgi:hypothetical protein
MYFDSSTAPSEQSRSPAGEEIRESDQMVSAQSQSPFIDPLISPIPFRDSTETRALSLEPPASPISRRPIPESPIRSNHITAMNDTVYQPLNVDTMPALRYVPATLRPQGSESVISFHYINILCRMTEYNNQEPFEGPHELYAAVDMPPYPSFKEEPLNSFYHEN